MNKKTKPISYEAYLNQKYLEQLKVHKSISKIKLINKLTGAVGIAHGNKFFLTPSFTPFTSNK